MNTLGAIVLVAAIPAMAILFGTLRPTAAVLLSLIGGYLLLPPGAIQGFALVPVTKDTCLSAGLLLGMLVGGSGSWGRFRLNWWDSFMGIWCFVPIASSLSNDLGLYDGVATSSTYLLIYGVPYLAGRVFLSGLPDLAGFGRALVIGGLVYLPLCWFEMRMSPRLNWDVYGFSTQGVVESKRLGGWRPSVFLQHGLAAGMWMAASALASLGLWRTRQLSRVWGIPAWLCAAMLCGTAVGCSSSGAIVLLGVGSTVIFVSTMAGSWRALSWLAMLPPIYLVSRVVFDWRPDGLVELVAGIDAERAGSLRIRVESDSTFRAHAMLRPWFGWGGWGRGTSVAYAPDSFFGIALTKHGVVGLIGAFGALIAAQLNSLRRLRQWGGTPGAAVVAPLVVVLATYTLDCLLNGMINPVFTALAGALVGYGSAPRGVGVRLPPPVPRGDGGWNLGSSRE